MRFLTAFVSGSALVLFAVSSTTAQTRPDFAGTWTLDPASLPAPPAGGGSRGVNPPPQLTFTQDANTVTMSWTQEGRKATETFHLDGSESTTQAGSVMTAAWEANTLVVVIRANLGGNVILQRRVLSIDRGDLVIELAPDVQDGDPTVVRIVYKKA
jgi:hypothetical protein